MINKKLHAASLLKDNISAPVICLISLIIASSEALTKIISNIEYMISPNQSVIIILLIQLRCSLKLYPQDLITLYNDDPSYNSNEVSNLRLYLKQEIDYNYKSELFNSHATASAALEYII